MAEPANSNRRGIFPSLAILIAIGMAASARTTLAGDASAAPPVSAGAAATAVPADSSAFKEAKVALRKAIAYHREAQDLSLKFTAQVYNAALDKHDAYQGRLLLKGADKFRLEIPGGTYVSDGTTYWEYHPQTKQAIRKAAADGEGAIAPGAVLLRFLDSDPLSAASVREDGKEWIELRLDPSRAIKNLDSLTVLLDKETCALHRISSRDVSGDEARYTVVSIKRNAGLKEKEFAFAPPKGVEVVDMRE
jgi:chaperone LolA